MHRYMVSSLSLEAGAQKSETHFSAYGYTKPGRHILEAVTQQIIDTNLQRTLTLTKKKGCHKDNYEECRKYN